MGNISSTFVLTLFSSVLDNFQALIRPSFWLLLPLLFLLSCAPPADDQQGKAKENIPVPPLKRMSQEQYGINVGDHQIIQDSFPENQLLVDVLQTFGVERSVIDTIDTRTADGFNVRNMKAGHPYTILKSTESQDVEFFIYEETEEDFVVIDLRDGVNISRGNQPVSSEIRTVYLPITTSLYEATKAEGVDVALVKSLESIFSNHVDFRHLDLGDYCKVIFEERYVDGAFIGLGQVQAAEFHQGKNRYQAFLYEMNDSISLYVDEYGENLSQNFLPTPVDSSHLANAELSAPTGFHQFQTTEAHVPVLAVCSGTISQLDSISSQEFQLTLRYSDVSSVQYHSLSEFAGAISQGLRITQGDTLGFTGALSSGKQGVELAFWNHGEKVNDISTLHFAFPPTLPIDQTAFQQVRKRLSRQLYTINMGLM